MKFPWQKKPRPPTISSEALSRASLRDEIASSQLDRLWSCVASGNNIVLSTSEIEDLLNYIMSLEMKADKNAPGPATKSFEGLVSSGRWSSLAISSYEKGQYAGASESDLAAIRSRLSLTKPHSPRNGFQS